MGNSNSGRYGGKLQCEQCLSIDIRNLARQKILTPNNQFTWTWPNNSSVGMTVRDDSIDFKYSIDGSASQIYTVYLDCTNCHYGGQRPWFRCPRCDGRSAKLFLRNGHFNCRRCHRLGYRSQVIDKLTQQQKAYGRLQNKLDTADMKPKGMHWRTFEQIHKQMAAIDTRINQTFNLVFMQLRKRITSSKH
jgi:hypothetical protein